MALFPHLPLKINKANDVFVLQSLLAWVEPYGVQSRESNWSWVFKSFIWTNIRFALPCMYGTLRTIQFVSIILLIKQSTWKRAGATGKPLTISLQLLKHRGRSDSLFRQWFHVIFILAKPKLIVSFVDYSDFINQKWIYLNCPAGFYWKFSKIYQFANVFDLAAWTWHSNPFPFVPSGNDGDRFSRRRQLFLGYPTRIFTKLVAYCSRNSYSANMATLRWSRHFLSSSANYVHIAPIPINLVTRRFLRKIEA